MTCFFCVPTNTWPGLCFCHCYWLLNGVGINKKWFYSSESSATLVAVLAIMHSECQMCFSGFWSHAIPCMTAKQPAHSLLGGRYQIASHLISIRHHLAFSRILYSVLVKSRILKISFQTLTISNLTFLFEVAIEFVCLFFAFFVSKVFIENSGSDLSVIGKLTYWFEMGSQVMGPRN